MNKIVTLTAKSHQIYWCIVLLVFVAVMNFKLSIGSADNALEAVAPSDLGLELSGKFAGVLLRDAPLPITYSRSTMERCAASPVAEVGSVSAKLVRLSGYQRSALIALGNPGIFATMLPNNRAADCLGSARIAADHGLILRPTGRLNLPDGNTADSAMGLDGKISRAADRAVFAPRLSLERKMASRANLFHDAPLSVRNHPSIIRSVLERVNSTEVA